MKERKRIIGWYVVSDIIAAAISWYGLFLFRKTTIEQKPFDFWLPFTDHNFFIAMLVVPVVWVLFHYLTGTYTDLYKKSRLQELAKTLLLSFAGVVVLFFSLLLDDYIRRFTDYYLTFFVLFFLQFAFTLSGRMLLLSIVKSNIRKGKVCFGTLLIGSSHRANELYEEFTSKGSEFGLRFVGFLGLNGQSHNKLTAELPELGKLNDLENILLQKP